MIDKDNFTPDRPELALWRADLHDYVRISYTNMEGDEDYIGGVVTGVDKSVSGAKEAYLYRMLLEDPDFEIEFSIVGIVSPLGADVIEAEISGRNDYRPTLDDFYSVSALLRKNEFISLGEAKIGENLLIVQSQRGRQLPPLVLHNVSNIEVDKQFDFNYDYQE